MVGIVPDVAAAIWDTMVQDFMPVPRKDDWKVIADVFAEKWQFPHCVGAIDGKHIAIKAPGRSGSLFRNYKGYFSIVLLAVADANHLFRVVDIGAYGGGSDGGVLAVSHFGRALREGTLDLPNDAPLPNAEHLGPLPYVFVGDQAFPLRRDLLRPYTRQSLHTDWHRIYNYRLSRARHIVESSFGVLTSRFRVYHGVIELNPDHAEKVVKATTILHNFLSWGQQHIANIPDAAGGAARRPFAGREERYIQDSFMEYFNSPGGAVPWQYDYF